MKSQQQPLKHSNPRLLKTRPTVLWLEIPVQYHDLVFALQSQWLEVVVPTHDIANLWCLCTVMATVQGSN